jgi:hypothetical protein
MGRLRWFSVVSSAQKRVGEGEIGCISSHSAIIVPHSFPRKFAKVAKLRGNWRWKFPVLQAAQKRVKRWTGLYALRGKCSTLTEEGASSDAGCGWRQRAANSYFHLVCRRAGARTGLVCLAVDLVHVARRSLTRRRKGSPHRSVGLHSFLRRFLLYNLPTQ